VIPPAPPALPDPASAPALKDVYGGSFLIGGAIEPFQTDATTNAPDVALLAKHYSSITAENVMKPETIALSQGVYDFAPADRLVTFARTNGMGVRGHTLLWHRTAPGWFFAGDRSDPVTYRALVRQRLETYITDVVNHFEGDVYAWDVVNEVAGDSPAQRHRVDSPWYEAFSVGGADGADYIEYAFRAARAADPNVKLFLNDYGTENPSKRAHVLAIVQDLIDKGVPIDGVGHQFHLGINAQVADIDAALSAVETLSSTLLNQVTELDASIYNDPASCYSSPPSGCQADYGTSSPPQSVLSLQASLYRALFNTFLEHDISIDSVTTWGISDAHTWLNSWPVNRTNRPLLFDSEGLPKSAFWAVADSGFVIP
jgi:endo-1,4-beta-xylanase